MDPKLWKLVRSHNKHLIAVFKNEDRGLLADTRGLSAGMEPIAFDEKKVRRLCWDPNGFTAWPQSGEAARVVRSVEKNAIKRQVTRKEEIVASEGFWVASPCPHLASTKTIVRAGHGQWGIENQGFSELGNLWHGDHAYKYNTHALIACTLLLSIAYNLFHAFMRRNLKPPLRARRTAKHWAAPIAAEFITALHPCAAPT